jgi:hypothetical protein
VGEFVGARDGVGRAVDGRITGAFVGDWDGAIMIIPVGAAVPCVESVVIVTLLSFVCCLLSVVCSSFSSFFSSSFSSFSSFSFFSFFFFSSSSSSSFVGACVGASVATLGARVGAYEAGAAVKGTFDGATVVGPEEMK